MPSPLFEKFKAALRFALADESAAAFATINAAPAEQTAGDVNVAVGAVGVPETAPSANEGIDIEGYRTINLTVEAAATCNVTYDVWVKNGTTWFMIDGSQNTLLLDNNLPTDAPQLALAPIDTEGFSRLWVRIQVSDAAVSFKGFPFNA